MFKRLIDGMLGRPALPQKPTYQESRAVLERHSAEMHRQLAARTAAEPEILYYLSEDEDAEIRRRVARNPSTPALANRRLADDSDDDVRATLARKIGRLLPHLADEQNERTRELFLETLERLAADALPRVREVVAQQIKASRHAPKALVLRLARDAELTVAAPILEYSPLLNDADLMEVVALAQVSDVLAAVARRRNLSPAMCNVVIATLDIPATAALIANGAANIDKQAFEHILARATEIEAWHEPLVARPNLSVRVMRRIAGFVSSALIERLAARHDVAPDLAADLKRSARTAIAEGALDQPRDIGAAQGRVRAAIAKGALDDAFVGAAAEKGERDTVILALAKLSGLSEGQSRRILESNNAHAVTALVWRAGLSMRVSLSIQTGLLKLRGPDILPARTGTDFPLTPEEMSMHLGLFAQG